MSNRNVILTGVPRSGTTLTCHLLNKLPNTVALHEPMNVGLFPKLKNRDAICDEIDRFFEATRRSIRTSKTAISKHINFLVPDNHFGDQRSELGLRMIVGSQGEIAVKKELTSDFLLTIKHPAAFTAMLKSLVKRFPCYAVIRNPLSVLASWNTIKVPLANGHAPAGERLDIDLAWTLDRIEDKTERQLHLLAWFFEKYQNVLPARSILRYENVISSGGKSLSVITPQAQELNEMLENKNKNILYDKELMQFLGDKLLRTDGAFWEFYSKKSVELLLED